MSNAYMIMLHMIAMMNFHLMIPNVQVDGSISFGRASKQITAPHILAERLEFQDLEDVHKEKVLKDL